MRRFTKVASLLVAASVFVCGAAFAFEKLKDVPGNLAAPTDVHMISEDVFGSTGSNANGDLLVSQDKTSGLGSLTFNAFIRSRDISLYHDDFGGFTQYPNPGQDSKFNKLLVRSTTYPVEMKFVVSLDSDLNDAASNDVNGVTFSLRGKAERKLAASKRMPSDDWTAEDCSIACNNFYYYMDHKKVSHDTPEVERTRAASVNWTGTGDTEFFVECCDYFGLVTTSVDVVKGEAIATSKNPTKSRDMVVAHLSETPFLRVRVADEYNVASTDAGIDPLSADFRSAYWKTAHFNTKGAVDVPEGKTYHMGVVYSVSGDCTGCADPICETSTYILPYVAVTNLGTESVYIEKNLTDSTGLVITDNKVESNLSWLCNAWCGLCEYDDMMSGDKGGLGAGSSAKISDQSAIWDCACHIFPAFTNTWKGAGNMDFNYRAYKAQGSDIVTKITGRLNTAWFGQELSNSGLCDSCSQSGLWIFYPCECPEELYEKAMGYTDLVFAKDGDDNKDVSLESFNEDAAADEYAAVSMVVSIDKGLVSSADFAANKNANIVLTKLHWTVKAASLSDAGLLNLTEGQWWRSEFWNKMAIKLNGIKLDAANVDSIGTNSMTAEELSFLTVIDGPQRELTVTTDVDVNLYVFVVDSDSPAVKYYKTSKGNRFLVVYDGNLDGKFSLKGTVVKGAGDTPVSADFALSPTALDLNIAVDAEKAKPLEAVNAYGAVVRWSVASNDFVDSNDIISISATSGGSITVTGVAVGTAKVYASISGDVSKSADCTITVKEVAPAPSGDSGGGCNVGFAPALLLLLAPLAFLKK